MSRPILAAAVILSGLAGVCMPAHASAQARTLSQDGRVLPQQVVPRYPVNPFYNFPVTPPNTPRDLRLESELNAERQKRLAMQYSPTRVRLANQVADLIDQGDCGRAAQLAWFEHDSSIAAAVPAACRAQRLHLKSGLSSVSPLSF